MNEVSRLIDEFFGNGQGKIMFFGEQENSLHEVLPFFQKLEDFERPDAFSVIEDTALIVEHFEFDSTNANKKGSSNRAEQARVERDFEKEVNAVQFNPGDTFRRHDVLSVHHSSENYIKNALAAFNKHYEKIESYKQNLLEKGKITETTRTKVMFWIEDTTLLGNVFLSKPATYNTQPQTLVLLHCDKFLDVLEECEKLDYILCFSHYGMQKFCWFLDMKNICDYRENQVKISDVTILDFQPKTTGFVIALNGGVNK